jgi:hypothetical protein
MCTVNYLLSRRTSTDDNSSSCSNLTQPVFFLAFTRKGPVTIEELRAAGMKYNLVSTLLDDYTFDLFSNNVDLESMFWNDTIIEFRRNTVSSIPPEEDATEL